MGAVVGAGDDGDGAFRGAQGCRAGGACRPGCVENSVGPSTDVVLESCSPYHIGRLRRSARRLPQSRVWEAVRLWASARPPGGMVSICMWMALEPTALCRQVAVQAGAPVCPEALRLRGQGGRWG